MRREPGHLQIMIITSVHPWNDTRIFYKEATSLTKKAHTVVLIGVANEKKIFYQNGIKIYTMKKRRRLIRWINWIPIIKIILREKSEIIHFHDPELIPLGIAAKLIKKKVIFDIHEDFAKQLSDKDWIPKYIRKILSKVYKRFECYLPKLFAKIILAEDSYLDNFSTSNNIKVIHNYPRIPLECKSDYGFVTFRMVYVGNIRIIRGIKEYINILETLLRNNLNVELLIIGDFTEKKLEIGINGLIRERKVESKIQFFGRIPNEEIYPILMKCDIGLSLLHPVKNYLESYPTKIFEYMSVGLPVLASNFELWKNIILQNECGSTVDPYDINASFEIIKKYYFSEDLRRTHGANGRNAIKTKYNWENEEKLLYGLYASMICNQ